MTATKGLLLSLSSELDNPAARQATIAQINGASTRADLDDLLAALLDETDAGGWAEGDDLLDPGFDAL